MEKVNIIMGDGDAALVAIHQSRAEDKLMGFVSSGFSSGSSSFEMIILLPLILLILFLIFNFSHIRPLFKSFMRGFVGLFIKFEDENINPRISNSADNCNNCGGNSWKESKCRYCGSTFKSFFLLAIVVMMFGCGNPEPAVKSPFSHLDTVTVKKQDAPKEEEKSNGLKSPFSGLDKK